MQSGGTRQLAVLVTWAVASAVVHAAPARMIVAARAYGEPLIPQEDAGFAYDLRSVEFSGRCRAAFGTVQVAQFSYVQAGGPDDNPPPRGHTFILFFDGACRLRTYWEVDAPLDGTVLRCGAEPIFDFANWSSPDTILVDGKP